MTLKKKSEMEICKIVLVPKNFIFVSKFDPLDSELLTSAMDISVVLLSFAIKI